MLKLCDAQFSIILSISCGVLKSQRVTQIALASVTDVGAGEASNRWNEFKIMKIRTFTHSYTIMKIFFEVNEKIILFKISTVTSITSFDTMLTQICQGKISTFQINITSSCFWIY